MSIRGLFLYVSPTACNSILGYASDELQGKNITQYIHPSDLSLAMRELRFAQSTAGIHLLCRFRHKSGFYVYLELRGRLYGDDLAKKHRCIIMTGRPVQMGLLLAGDIMTPGCSKTETWAKISHQGLFLYNCKNSKEVLGLDAKECYSKSLFDFVDQSFHATLRWSLKQCLQCRYFDVPTICLRVPKGNIICHLRIYNDANAISPHFYCQIKVLIDGQGKSYPLSIESIGDVASDVVQNENIFDFMMSNCSVYYEMNQLRVENKRLQEEIENIEFLENIKASKQ
jgi:PAS domain S-box-containing protein